MSKSLLSFIKHKEIALLGIARSTLSTYDFLKKQGFKLYIWDDNEGVRDKYKNSKLNIVNFKTWNFAKLDAVITSPGIPLYYPKKHDIINYIEQFKVPLLSDIELFYYFFPNYKYIGVTGSNGKSSLVTLLLQIFKLAGKNVALAGNIGVPIFSLKELLPNSYIILELSSFQLSFLQKMRLHIAVLLNIYPNHNSYHGNFTNYKNAKFNIFNNQNNQDYALINLDQSYGKALIQEANLNGKIITLSAKGNAKASFFIKQGLLYKKPNKNIANNATGTKIKLIYNFNQFTNSGEVFLQMVLFAYVISNLVQIDLNTFIKAVQAFSGLPHRQELVVEYNNIAVINDSKATTPKAAAAALAIYNNIYWLLGGARKSGTLKPCIPYYHKIKHVFIFGKDKTSFAKELQGKLNFSLYDSLKEAIIAAVNMAKLTSPNKIVNSSATITALNSEQSQKKLIKKTTSTLIAKTIDINSSNNIVIENNSCLLNKNENTATVLLSPIGTSFDEFTSFEARGDYFKSIVKELINASL